MRGHKPLSELIKALKDAGLLISFHGSADRFITDVVSDSRAVCDGVVFVCIRGLKHDGHDFIPDCVSRGASAIIVEDEEKALPVRGNATLVRVSNARKALALLASNFFGEPSKLLRLIGVTGTNGKTTTVHMIAACLHLLGRRVATMGTMGASTDDGMRVELPHTTPEAPIIQRHLSMFANMGIQDVVMEVSSHALLQSRVLGCTFDAAVFTNLTQDHLDYHGNMNSYFHAKALLFTEYIEHARSIGKQPVAIINGDDPYGKRLLEICPSSKITYGLSKWCEVYASNMGFGRTHTEMVVHIRDGRSLHIKMPLVGKFNVYNALATIATLVALGEDISATVEALRDFKPPRGRLERVDEGQDFMVLVDYAHTPDGLLQVLETLKPLKGDGRLIVVFGCGGDRDPTKRPKMGQIASANSDLVIVTSDNPRSEDPLAIIKQILSGVEEGKRAKVIVEPDRRKAIFKAIEIARSGDIVLIAGKGHERYQIIGQERIPFDDHEVAREALRTVGGIRR